MKNFVLFFLAFVAGWRTPAAAQTLFTIGTDTVTVAQFITAFQKNNTSKDPQGISGYRELYIAARLKVAEARALGMDTTVQFIADFKSLREQILPTYMSDEEAISARVKEAFVRGRKDIRFSHIYIAAGADSTRAAQRAAEAYQKLKAGTPFAQVARNYSDDPSAATSGGEAGWVTVFTLPYGLEQLLYSTRQGSISNLFRSGRGFHIFKNEAEAPAAGRMKAAQILIAFPPGATADARQKAKRLADSLHTVLLRGGDFGALAGKFSNDVVSAASNGLMPEFGRGQYHPLFEEQAFALPKDGALSRPFLTEFGWHIVKRLKRVPPPTVLDEKTSAVLREQVLQSDWVKVSEDALIRKVLQQAPFAATSFQPETLWAFTDSMLRSPSPAAPGSGRSLGQIGKQDVTLSQWIDFARVERFGAGAQRAYADLFWNGFIPAQALQYYKDNLESFHPLFRSQMHEFMDGNLFFEIMQQKVWGPAQEDTAALRNWYEANRSRYQWSNSADAVIFYAGDEASATLFRKSLSPDPSRWKEKIIPYSDKIIADSGRFEITAIPGGAGTQLKSGSLTPSIVNKNDNTVSFAYIVRVHPKGGQRSFEEAKGLVTADYQESLERTWVQSLKTKYGVVVNEAAWSELLDKF